MVTIGIKRNGNFNSSDVTALEVLFLEDTKMAKNDNLPFEVVHDKEIMDFIQQYQADIQYVIFVSKRVVKILKTSSIPDILTEKNYQNFATLPVIGLTIKYGGGGSTSF